MFTGIVQAVGTIIEVRVVSDDAMDARIAIDAGALDCTDVVIGDSVAINGACLTVVAVAESRLEFDVSAETLRCTTGLSEQRAVNLEKALRFGERLGGHLVAGHVDGIGIVRKFHPAGDSHLLEVEVPDDLARYIAVKGSITVDGVSLTVNTVTSSSFTVNLIPHTLAVTKLGSLKVGDQVNLEADMIARYLERLLAARNPESGFA